MSRTRSGISPPSSGGLVVLANQGAPAAIANAWPVGIAVGGVIVDPRAIRLLTAADIVTLAAGGSIDITDRLARQLGRVVLVDAANAVLVGQKTMANSVPVTLASDQSTPLPAVAEHRAATLHVTGTAAVNTALTITLPAAGAGLFHYITSIQWFKLYSVIGVAAGAGVIITSTNLPGGPAWTTEQLASAAGTVAKVIDYQPTTPLKSSVANTATTIVAPLQLQTIWRGNVSYFTAA